MIFNCYFSSNFSKVKDIFSLPENIYQRVASIELIKPIMTTIKPVFFRYYYFTSQNGIVMYVFEELMFLCTEE